MRVEFPGSFDGDSVSEWFVVDPAKRKPFLDFLDKKVYYDVLVPPIHGTAFTARASKKIKMQPQARGVGCSEAARCGAQQRAVCGPRTYRAGACSTCARGCPPSPGSRAKRNDVLCATTFYAFLCF